MVNNCKDYSWCFSPFTFLFLLYSFTQKIYTCAHGYSVNLNSVCFCMIHVYFAVHQVYLSMIFCLDIRSYILKWQLDRTTFLSLAIRVEICLDSITLANKTTMKRVVKWRTYTHTHTQRKINAKFALIHLCQVSLRCNVMNGEWNVVWEIH